MPPAMEIRSAVGAAFVPLRSRIKPGGRIAIAVGSRGIVQLQEIVTAAIEEVREAGGIPFIIPAMGSHGGATEAGQAEILAGYGVSTEALGVEVRPSLDVKQVGLTEDGISVYCSVAALEADAILVVNRIKPHTDFRGAIGSGLLKMLVIGLGKRRGASMCHQAATRLGLERAIRSISEVILRNAPVIGGIGIVENQRHQIARIAGVVAEEMVEKEEELFKEAKALMPRLPFEDVDLLIVDKIGKNISGAGMDPNVTGRWVHGYSSSLAERPSEPPDVRRLFVRDLTAETHGNGIGIGFADFTTSRLVREFDYGTSYINALTSITPNSVKIPIHFETDCEVIEKALASLAMEDWRDAKVMRIRDTLSLSVVELSEAYDGMITARPDLERVSTLEEMRFNSGQNLLEFDGQ